MKLYYSPGACSLAPHIAFEETGATYALQLVSIQRDEQQASEHLKVNPRGKIPALHTDEGLLTKNVAIRPTSPARFRRRFPEEPIDLARCISHLAYLSNTVHPAFSYIVRSERFATDEAAHDNLRATGRPNASKLLEELGALLGDREWVLGSRYSIADPYMLVIYG